MGAAVPADDLPSARAVPEDDLPGAEHPFMRYLRDVAEGGKFGGPLGMAYGASMGANRLIEHGAYKAGGAATDLATSAGLSPEAAAKVGVGTNMAVQAAPVVAGGVVGKMVAPAVGLGETARDLMQSAMKPTYEALRTGKAAKAIDTMFEEGINVTKGGVAKLRAKIGDLNDEIVDAIKNSSATVDKNKVASALLVPLKKFEMQVNPASDMASIQKAWTEFLQHPLLAGKSDMPVQTAQAMKQGTYQALGDKSYGELKGAEIEAQKHLARGLKDEIAAAVPEVGPLNAQESKMLNALSITERRVLMDANKNPNGLALLAKNPEAWAAFLADRSPTFKSLAARFLNANKDTIPVAVGATAGAGAGLRSGSSQ